jgi:DNA polymerase
MQDAGFIDDLLAILKYHRNSGITHYSSNEDIVCFLQSFQQRRKESRRIVVEPPVSVYSERQRPGRKDQEKQAAIRANTDVTLSDIAEEIAGCRACDLANQRLSARAGAGGGEKIRLLVVGDWLRGEADLQMPESVQFGVQEDQMLIRMLTAINLPSDQVFITNAIKCVIPESCQPTAENIRICLSYLQRQIALLAPEVICVMGMVATRVVLGHLQPLSKLRGRFHSFNMEDGRQIPVLATYHPSFLLQNPEMKKAAWTDLQILGRQLKTLV